MKGWQKGGKESLKNPVAIICKLRYRKVLSMARKSKCQYSSSFKSVKVLIFGLLGSRKIRHGINRSPIRESYSATVRFADTLFFAMYLPANPGNARRPVHQPSALAFLACQGSMFWTYSSLMKQEIANL